MPKTQTHNQYKVRHPRLHAYYESTTMSLTTMALALTSVIWYYSGMAPAATVAMAALGAIFIGYSIWYWTGRRKTVRCDHLTSELTSYYVIIEMLWATFCLDYDWPLTILTLLALAIFATHLIRLDRSTPAPTAD